MRFSPFSLNDKNEKNKMSGQSNDEWRRQRSQTQIHFDRIFVVVVISLPPPLPLLLIWVQFLIWCACTSACFDVASFMFLHYSFLSFSLFFFSSQCFCRWLWLCSLAFCLHEFAFFFSRLHSRLFKIHFSFVCVFFFLLFVFFFVHSLCSLTLSSSEFRVRCIANHFSFSQ